MTVPDIRKGPTLRVLWIKSRPGRVGRCARCRPRHFAQGRARRAKRDGPYSGLRQDSSAPETPKGVYYVVTNPAVKAQ
jgi:hypothetical protein